MENKGPAETATAGPKSGRSTTNAPSSQGEASLGNPPSTHPEGLHCRVLEYQKPSGGTGQLVDQLADQFVSRARARMIPLPPEERDNFER